MNKLATALLVFASLLSSFAFATGKPVDCAVSGNVDGKLNSTPMHAAWDKDQERWIYTLQSPGGSFDFQVSYTDITGEPYLEMTINRQIQGRTVSTVLNTHSTNLDLYSGETNNYYSMICK